MRQIIWLASRNDRGNFVMTKGNFYDLDKSKKPVSDHTFETWIEEGAAMLKEDWLKLQEQKSQETKVSEPEETEEADDEEILDKGDLHKIKKLSDEPPKDETEDLEPYKEAEIEGIPFDSDSYDCPKEDCYRHGDPYKNSWSYISHMKKQHGEIWVKVEDRLIPKDD